MRRDHVEPPPEHLAMVDELLAKQAETRVSDADANIYHNNAAGFWDTFYSRHENRFFKDRKWLHLEFPELIQATHPDAGPRTIVEVGCGAGNTVFPLLAANQNPDLRLVACDYAAQAVEVIRANPLYANPPCGRCDAHVWDLSAGSATDAQLPPGVEPGSVDIVVLVFVLSALHPREWASAAHNVYTMLKPKTGLVLLRDYGRHDLPQLRFKKNRLLDDNFYVRGDGTRVYFFEPDELYALFDASPREVRDNDHTEDTHRFGTLQMAVDRRLLVNRKEKKRMYRVWVQAKFQKQ
ncbi:tRNA(Thr) (cytosine(32)-N(3))-methyltransferase [Malassezia brasiliensis]|uniref:tRNA N(3)-methylcytidine methyltransferase n=1 Tax=Malassezia brasiliensis TaxID=1821822 RepID=A0AAF0DU46_9BASI|nr:tRNA(Thr) (cytosine(32)-N(3))-methyltransferase [Malassezia brasiliensis]